MTAPFSGAPTRTDWLLAAELAAAQIWGDYGLAAIAMQALGVASVEVFPQTLFCPAVVVGVVPGLAVVSVTGTTSTWEWAGEVLASAQVPVLSLPGQVSAFFGVVGLATFGRVAELLRTLPGGTPVAFLGHSLGGALAQIAAVAAANEGYTAACYTLGCPRVGDPTFAAAAVPTWRLENTDDPIPAVPPVLWAGVGSRFPAPGPGPLATYLHAGDGFTMDGSGVITPGSFPPPLSLVLRQLLFRAAPTHQAPEYARRLRQQWVGADFQAPGAQGYPNPAALGAVWEDIRPATGPLDPWERLVIDP